MRGVWGVCMRGVWGVCMKGVWGVCMRGVCGAQWFKNRGHVDISEFRETNDIS